MTTTEAKISKTCANCKSSIASSANIRLGCYFGDRLRAWLPRERAEREAFCETNNFLVELKGCKWEKGQTS
jgi:hypothetical protein